MYLYSRSIGFERSTYYKYNVNKKTCICIRDNLKKISVTSMDKDTNIFVLQKQTVAIEN